MLNDSKKSNDKSDYLIYLHQMKEGGLVYRDIEKEINANHNTWSDHLKDSFWRIFYLINKREFQFKGDIYQYYYHPYNKTWRNERAIEIPICKNVLSQYNNKNILEVGNVLSHYFPCSHTIVDKYEKGAGIINADITEYHTDKKFDLIISISTLEHIGWDEIPKDPDKTLRSIEHMRKMLAAGGKIFITIPLGYNPDLQKFINNKKISFSETAYIKRSSPEKKSFLLKSPSYNNFWKEVPEDEVKYVKYDTPFPGANALLIGSLFNS
jgi:hypothetical protein